MTGFAVLVRAATTESKATGRTNIGSGGGREIRSDYSAGLTMRAAIDSCAPLFSHRTTDWLALQRGSDIIINTPDRWRHRQITAVQQ